MILSSYTILHKFIGTHDNIGMEYLSAGIHHFTKYKDIIEIMQCDSRANRKSRFPNKSIAARAFIKDSSITRAQEA